DEADVAGEPIAFRPRISPEHAQVSLVGRETDNRVQRGGLAGAVGTDQPDDAALLDLQIDAVEGDGRAVRLVEAASLDVRHGVSAPRERPAGDRRASVRAAASAPGFSATRRPGTCRARLSAAARGRPR